jgi:hypothetical protein
VPTRYQSSTTTAEDYAGGNFIFIEATVTMGATAHNWTVCQYRNQAGTDAQTAPSMAGISSCAQDRLDMPLGSWFMPLASGDTGAMDLTQMQCSASVTGAPNFVIGHPLGWLSFPLANGLYPFDWLTAKDQAPRVFDNACLALLEINKGNTAVTTYSGRVYLTGTG